MRRKGAALSDAELQPVLELARQYESKALAQLCEYFYPKIYRYICFRVNTLEDGQDLTNQVFLRMVQSIRKQRGSVHAWIFRIAVNIIRDYYRRRAVRKELERPPESAEVVADEVTNPDSVFEQERLRRAIDRLTGDQQDVIVLKFVEGYENAEIADMLGKSVEAIRALQFRALSALRNLLGDE